MGNYRRPVGPSSGWTSRRGREARPATLLLAGLLFSACSGGGTDSVPPFTVTDLSGQWSVYRTYAGQPERGPDLTEWSNSGTGYGIAMHAVCSTFVLPGAVVDIAGEIHDADVSLSSSDATWSGAVSANASSMSGTFSDSRGSGIWRAVRTTIGRCQTYEVYGGNSYLPCGGVEGYNPQNNAYAYLGSATATQTFPGTYSYYVILTRDLNVIQLDSVQGSNGTYYGTISTGNTIGYASVGGPPDAQFAIVGAGRISGGGYVDIDASASAPDALTVILDP